MTHRSVMTSSLRIKILKIDKFDSLACVAPAAQRKQAKRSCIYIYIYININRVLIVRMMYHIGLLILVSDAQTSDLIADDRNRL